MSDVPFPCGSIPTMITPFCVDGSVDYETVDKLVEWYILSGCVGIFSPCLSSEMFELSEEERLALAQRIAVAVGDRDIVVVSTGTYGGPLEDQASFINKISAHCDAVVVNTSTIAPLGASDEEWRAAASTILSLTGNVKLGLYECPLPFKRLLSPALIEWSASTGRFWFHKDTSCSTSDMQAKLNAIASVKGTPFRFYNANVETLLASLEMGGHGFSGICANLYPHLSAWLCANHDRDRANASTVQDFLSVAEATVCVNYPASAKLYLCNRLVQNHLCRTKGEGREPKGKGPFLEHQRAALDSLRRMCNFVCRACGIPDTTPPLHTNGAAE